jgi:hypothetical protein
MSAIQKAIATLEDVVSNRSVILYAEPLADSAREAIQALQSLEGEAVAVRYDFDGFGYLYLDDGSGSDWLTRHDDAEPLYTAPQPPTRQEHPVGHDNCPITGRVFWGNIEHPEFGVIATYGGPLDTYSIPRMHEDGEIRCEQFDQDAGEWVEGGELNGWFYKDQPDTPQPPAMPDIGSTKTISAAIKHLGSWLDQDLCECEHGHSCGRTEVTRTLIELQAMLAAAQQGDGNE